MLFFPSFSVRYYLYINLPTTSSNDHFSLAAIFHACNLGFDTLRHNISFTVYVYALQIRVYFHFISIGTTDFNILLVEIVYFPVYFYFMLFAIQNGTGIWGYPYTIEKVTWDIDQLICLFSLMVSVRFLWMFSICEHSCPNKTFHFCWATVNLCKFFHPTQLTVI